MVSIFSRALDVFLKTLLLRGEALDSKRSRLLTMANAQYTFTKYTELWTLSYGYSERG